MAEREIDKGSLAPHLQTYGGVVSMLKWGTVAAAMVAAFVIWLIAT